MSQEENTTICVWRDGRVKECSNEEMDKYFADDDKPSFLCVSWSELGRAFIEFMDKATKFDTIANVCEDIFSEGK